MTGRVSETSKWSHVGPTPRVPTIRHDAKSVNIGRVRLDLIVLQEVQLLLV